MRHVVLFLFFLLVGLGLVGIGLVARSSASSAEANTVLYDANLGTLPNAQSFDFQNIGVSAEQRYEDGRTILDTDGNLGDYAGYVGKNMPVLDRQEGYELSFVIQVLAESHDNYHRSGFSLITLDKEAVGIELAFWKDQIWVQDDDDMMFEHAEGVAYDTTVNTFYTLRIEGETYKLWANGQPLLSGAVRDYKPYEGAIDPYETPNFLFLGDDTTSAGGETAIAYVALSSDATQPTATMTPSPTFFAPTATQTPTPDTNIMTTTPGPASTATPEPNMTTTPAAGSTTTPAPNMTTTPGPASTVTPEPNMTTTPAPPSLWADIFLPFIQAP